MKRALVIGGTTGIGARIADILNSKNIHCETVGRETFDINTSPYDVDLSSYDYLILSAGVDPNGLQPFLERDWSDIKLTLDTNLVNQIKIAHRYLNQRRGKWSKLIFVGSAHNPDRIQKNHLPYGLSKHAQKTFVDALRREVADKNTGIVLIRVGKTKTNLHKNRLGANWKPEDDDQYYSGAYLTLDDITKQITYIIEDENHYLQEFIMASSAV